jgi:2-dehydro-3-deoxygluconokinase
MKKVFSFGELLLRISPEFNRQWIRKGITATYLGGAELNVVTALSKWNIPAKYLTALPDNDLSKEIIAELKEMDIDTSSIIVSGNKIGIYYLPQGADLKHAGVIYDRADSSFAVMKPGTINWDEVLKDCGWLHFSAISPALNNNAALLCKEALQAASSKGLTISVDLNYRNKLWQYGKQPKEVMTELISYCNIVMGNVWSAEKLLGIECKLKESRGKSKEELIEAAGKSMKEIHLLYPKVTTIAYTFRLEDTYFSVLQHGKERIVSNEISLQNIIDKAGSGDCFMAGLIYGFSNQLPLQETINFASLAAAGKLMEKGDATNQTIYSVMNNLSAKMDVRENIIQKLKHQKLLPLYYHNDATVCIEIAKALYASGIRLIEFTNRGENALKNFMALVQSRNENMKDLLLAVGTIKTAEQANDFINAGAEFIISPVFDIEISNTANRKSILYIPGCMTPTEIHAAENAGHKIIKLFPGNLLTPSFVSSIKELFPLIDFMPTGGVEITKENLEEWFKAGVCAVGMGSKLISNKLLDAKDYKSIESATRRALEVIQSITKLQ